MVKVTFQGTSYEARDPSQTVLEILLENKVPHPFSCRGGVCQTCLMGCSSGSVSPESQEGLKQTDIAAGYFLPCVCVPTEDMSVSLVESPLHKTKARLIHKRLLNSFVVRLDLEPSHEIPCIPGQYLNLSPKSGLSRCYSIANIPEEDGYIELNIKFHNQGMVSSWAHQEAQVGDEVTITGPLGSCFYHNPEKKKFPILLLGAGTGIAPLRGILLDALRQEHQGSIYLMQGGLNHSHLYYEGEFLNLAASHSFFHYSSSLKEDGGDLKEDFLKGLTDLSQTRVYICGSPQLVVSLKKMVFLKGVPFNHIFSDAFLTHKSSEPLKDSHKPD